MFTWLSLYRVVLPVCLPANYPVRLLIPVCLSALLGLSRRLLRVSSCFLSKLSAKSSSPLCCLIRSYQPASSRSCCQLTPAAVASLLPQLLAAYSRSLVAYNWPVCQLPIYLTCLPSYLLAILPTVLQAYLLTFLLACFLHTCPSVYSIQVISKIFWQPFH